MSLLLVSSSLLPGDRAPDFTLNSVLDNKEEQVSLSSMRGQHVLLMFYPVDFGYVSPSEFYSIAPLLPLLASFHCSLLAISTEHINSQKNSQAAPRSEGGLEGMGVRLASDPVGEVARLYGVYKAEENLAFSAFYLIDPEGNIVAMEKCDFPVGRSTEEQVKIVAKVLDREDEVYASSSSNKLGRQPAAKPTMGAMAGGSVKSFKSNISNRSTKTLHSEPGFKTSKNDARSAVGSPNTPFAFSKKAGLVVSSNTGNTPYANSKQNSSKAGSVVSNTGNTPYSPTPYPANSKRNSSKAGSVVSNTDNVPFANSKQNNNSNEAESAVSTTGDVPFANSKQNNNSDKAESVVSNTDNSPLANTK